MSRLMIIAAVAGLAAALLAMAQPQPEPAPAEGEQPPREGVPEALNFIMTDIEGEPVDLAEYKGHAVLIVNVASKCGLTPQYAALQQLHERYHERGLRILAFPANDFNGQEPGTEKEIAAFCESTYGVEFDLFSKVSVKGEKQCDLYRYLTSAERNGEFGGEIEWNFTKFLLNRKGEVVARFDPRTRPDDPKVIEAIGTALSEEG